MEKLLKRLSNIFFLNFNIYQVKVKLDVQAAIAPFTCTVYANFAGQIYCMIKEVAMIGLFVFVYLSGPS